MFDCIKNPMTVHGIRRGAISEVSVKAQEKGCRLEDVLDFSRHKDIRTLQKYLKRSGKTQGKFSGFALDALSDQKEEDEECPSE